MAHIYFLDSTIADLEVARVVMESTGVYWKCVYYGLEGLFPQLWLVNAYHVKNVPGRKTDMADAEWLADVAAHGMVRPSLVPPARGPGAARADPLSQDPGHHARPGSTAPGQGPPRRRHQDFLGGLDRAGQVDSGPWSRPSLPASGTRPCWRHSQALGRMRPKVPALTEALAGRFGPTTGPWPGPSWPTSTS